VPFAAIQEGKVTVAGLRVGLILSAANVDLDASLVAAAWFARAIL